jgi:hypothetical protein
MVHYRASHEIGQCINIKAEFRKGKLNLTMGDMLLYYIW